MAKFYISYSRKDTDFVLALVDRLKGAGHEIVVDAEVLAPGRDWRATLDEGLKTADVFLVLLSNNTPDSPYTMMEVGSARAFAGAAGKPFLIPIAIDEIAVPLALQDIQILYAADRNLDRIMAEIDRGISSQHGLELAKAVKAGEVAARIQRNAPEYIEEAIKAQDVIKMRNNWAARIWYCIGFAALLAGIAFVVWTFGVDSGSDENWAGLVKVVIANFVVVGFLGACSRYAFSLGKSYTSEALKASDRIHAIGFGRFYLNAFPDRATWAELKEVFAHWNIDRTSAFNGLDVSQIDPQIISMIAQIASANLKKE